MSETNFFQITHDDNGFLTGAKIRKSNIETNIQDTLDNTKEIIKKLNTPNKKAPQKIIVSKQPSLANRTDTAAMYVKERLKAKNQKVVTSTEVREKKRQRALKEQQERGGPIDPKLLKNSRPKPALRVIGGMRSLKTSKHHVVTDSIIKSMLNTEMRNKGITQERDAKGRFKSTQFEQKQQTKILRKLLDKMGGGSGDGKSSGFLSKILPSFLTGNLAAGVAKHGITGRGGSFYKYMKQPGLLDKMKGAKGLGKGLGVLGLGLAAYDTYDIENSNMDRVNRNKAHIKTGSAMGGALAGGAAGAMIGSVVPGIGTAVGGVVGSIAGALGGKKLADYGLKKLDKAIDPRLSQKMLGSWGGFMEVSKQGVKKLFDSMPESIQNIGSGVATAYNKTTDAWNNSSVGQGVNEVVSKGAEAVSKASTWVSNVASKTIAGMSQRFGKLKYDFGAKSLSGQGIDCSGWVSKVQQETIKNINKEMGQGTISRQKKDAIIEAANGGAANMVKYARKQGGAMQDNQINYDNLKDGMVIGMAKSGTHAKGRYKDIGHIVTIFTDPKTGEKMVSESSTAETTSDGVKRKGGVRIRTLKEYLTTEQKRRNKDRTRHIYSGDPYAQERGAIDKTMPEVSRPAVNNAAFSAGNQRIYEFAFGNNVDQYLRDSAQRFGVSETYLRGVAKKEDGWKGDKSHTGALGVGQFTKGTWNGLIERYPKEAREIGMREITNANIGGKNDPRLDNRVNSLAMGLFTQKEVDRYLKNANLPVTDNNRYLVHNLGNQVVPVLKGGRAKNKAKYDLSTKQNGKKAWETDSQFLQRQVADYERNSREANKVTKAAGVMPKINSNSKRVKPQSLMKNNQLNIKPLSISPEIINQQQSRAPNYAFTNTQPNQSDFRIAHLPTRQVSHPTIAHIVSGGTNA